MKTESKKLFTEICNEEAAQAQHGAAVSNLKKEYWEK